MVTQCFTMFDKLQEEAGMIFWAKNETVAINNIVSSLLDTKQQQHDPSQFTLKYIGVFDTETCQMAVPEECPQTIDFLPALIEAREKIQLRLVKNEQ